MGSRTCTAALLLTLTLAFAGCINYEHHGTIRSDGSGSMTIHYWTKESVVEWIGTERFAFTERDVRARYAEVPGVKVKEVKVEQDDKDSTRHVHVSIEFTDVAKLSRTKAFPNLSFKVAKQNDDVLRLVQTVHADSGASGMGQEEFTVTYAWTMPGDISTSNATEVKGRTATWKLHLPDLSRNQDLIVEARIGGGRVLTPVLIVIGAVLVVAIALIIVMRRKKETGQAE